MSIEEKDSGQAYPAAWGNPEQGGDYVPGMTLRDWFAGQALAGHLASLNPGSWGNDLVGAEDAAKGAYLVADAMLKAREAGQ